MCVMEGGFDDNADYFLRCNPALQGNEGVMKALSYMSDCAADDFSVQEERQADELLENDKKGYEEGYKTAVTQFFEPLGNSIYDLLEAITKITPDLEIIGNDLSDEIAGVNAEMKKIEKAYKSC